MATKIGISNGYIRASIMIIWLLFLAWYHNQLVQITEVSNEELISPIDESQGKKQNDDSNNEEINVVIKTTADKSSESKDVNKESISSPIQECDATGEVTDCCCPMTCTESIMEKSVGMFSCKKRIQWVMTTYALTLRDACVRVAQVEYPQVCGSCDPDKCPVKVVTVHTNKYNEHIG